MILISVRVSKVWYRLTSMVDVTLLGPPTSLLPTHAHAPRLDHPSHFGPPASPPSSSRDHPRRRGRPRAATRGCSCRPPGCRRSTACAATTSTPETRSGEATGSCCRRRRRTSGFDDPLGDNGDRFSRKKQDRKWLLAFHFRQGNRNGRRADVVVSQVARYIYDNFSGSKRQSSRSRGHVQNVPEKNNNRKKSFDDVLVSEPDSAVSGNCRRKFHRK